MKIGTKVRVSRRNGETMLGKVTSERESGRGLWVEVTPPRPEKGAKAQRPVWVRPSQCARA